MSLARASLAAALVVGTLGGALARDAAAHEELEVLERDLARDLARSDADPELSLHLGRARLLEGDVDGALASLDQAARHGANPDAVAARRGEVFLVAGWPRRAIAEFDSVLIRRPDAYGVLYERGRAWLALEHPERAESDLARAVGGLPRPRPEQVLAWRDVLLSLGRREDAVRALDRGMERLGPAAALDLAALDLELELGRSADALRRIDRLLRDQPRNPAWLERRAAILESAGRYAEARLALTTTLETLQTRPPGRKGPTFADLERRVRAKLASNVDRIGEAP